MNFNKHSELVGKHAFLSASRHSWINYDDDKLYSAYMNSFSQVVGTTLHDYAAKRINFGMKLRRGDKDSVLFYLLDHGLPFYAIDLDRYYQNLMAYVNDAIGYKMTTEQILYYSDNCFGTADSISFRNGVLRIHDLKTGLAQASMDQLLIYAALFFLEYAEYKPRDTKVECRIYQSETVLVHEPETAEISDLMKTIVKFDKRIAKIKIGG